MNCISRLSGVSTLRCKFLLSVGRPRHCALLSTGVPALVAGVRQLRDLTGAPMMDCKAALVAENNDVEKAVAWLRKKGLTVAGKKSSREAAQGLVAVDVSERGDTASILEVCTNEYTRRIRI